MRSEGDAGSDACAQLSRRAVGDVVWHEDAELRERSGIVVAFSERTGGVSVPPYASLDLAAHTGDSPRVVDENRQRFLSALGLSEHREHLTCAEQVHGTEVGVVGAALAGSGGYATRGRPPVSGVDALATTLEGVPLMLLFADCVPVVLVAERSRSVAVAHAGWRGLLGGVVSRAVEALRGLAEPGEEISAYVGPHIGPCCYEVGEDLVSQFAHKFVTIRRASATLDLRAAVTEELASSGVPEERQCHLGICTAHNTDRFYSYRAEGRTGRHAALVCVLPRS
ncbi:MAG: laccase domain-containing protein [Coriobacteriia bacterium]|nr:laccase domain-containing protein [Coriobacteriia bacterium]